MTKPESYVDYEAAWDGYARRWRAAHPDLSHLGDEWIGREAGAADSLAAYVALIRDRFVVPWIRPEDTVLEIGVGGGRTAALLLDHCSRLICADVSAEMLDLTRRRLASDRASYVKLDGTTLDGVADEAADVCFCYDVMVHLEPRDIFNYLTLLPRVLRGRRLCVFHHADTLSERGFRKFLGDWRHSIGGRRHGEAFSVMTPAIMARFLDHLGYRVLRQDGESVPRDCVWICTAPEPAR
ncbi:MAG: class I SAM-dependent methyltransferase [Alphaproteobacteria bacterium]|nr:class I SAM-dependent methyltransferase [Alphaproteobacteria bacterium]